MRFQQLKNNPDTTMRKKMYKKGKNWVVASTLALGGIAMFSTPVVNAATADQGQTPTEQVEDNQGDKTPETPDKDTQTPDKGTNDKKYVNTTVTVKSNMGDQVYNVNGYCNSDVQITIHAIGMAVADKNVITVHIDDKGVATTKEELVYTP